MVKYLSDKKSKRDDGLYEDWNILRDLCPITLAWSRAAKIVLYMELHNSIISSYDKVDYVSTNNKNIWCREYDTNICIFVVKTSMLSTNYLYNYKIH